MIQKFKKLIKYIINECKDIKTFILLFIVIAVVYSPVWCGYLLYFIFKWEWCLIMATFCVAFWAGPFTPFFPLCISITLAIKRVIEKTASKKNDKNTIKADTRSDTNEKST